MHRKKLAKFLSFLLATALVVEPVAGFIPAMKVRAAEATISGNGTVSGGTVSGDEVQETIKITGFDYLDEANGATQAYKTGDRCFSFCYPKMNGEVVANGELEALESAFDILIKVGDEWEDVKTALTYEEDWKIDYWSWDGGGSYGLIFYLEETSYIRFQSKSDKNVYLDYTLEYPEEVPEAITVTKLSFDDIDGVIKDKRIEVLGNATAINFDYLNVNDGEAKGGAVQTELVWTVDTDVEDGIDNFVELGSTESGYTWDQNYGWDGAAVNGGFWFNPVKKSFKLRAALKSNTAVYADVLIYVDNTVDEKGAEYDFSATDNEKYDEPASKAVKEGYDLIWADEFNGYEEGTNVDPDTGLNLDNWTPQDGDGSVYGNPGWGNEELQAYTGRTENVGVNEDINNDGTRDGVLRITAAYEETPYTYGEESAKDYTSARLHSTKMDSELFNTTYGYVEARMSLPLTKGAWPAFWMLPQTSNIYGGWPVSGEIDIMETTGIRTNEACGTLHRGTPGQIYSGSGYVELDSDINYFHTYAIDWEPGKITWYYDGEKIHEEKNWESAISGASSSLAYDAPFDQPFYVLFNLAIDSGRFGGTENKATFQDDINMYVDYVRVYQREEGYADSVVREATSAGDDWEDYAGVNQIGTVTSDSVLDSEGQLYAMETAGTVDSNKWYLAYQDGGAATVEAQVDEDGKEWAKVGVTAEGTQDYSVQLIGHYNAKAGYVYKISYDAYADGDLVGKTISSTSTEWKGWGKYGRNQFTLTNEPTSYVSYIEQTADFDACRLEFNLGVAGTGNVYIGNVKVEIVNPSEYGTEEGGSRAPLANGDMIYNGTFDQGNNRLGYWTAGKDTTIVVPRYTKEDLTGNDISVVDVASKTNWEGIANGVKYYERRAQISAQAGTAPSIYQAGFPLEADSYTLNFEMYSEKETTVTASIYTADAAGNLGTKVLESDVVHYTANGVVNYTWTFTTPNELQNAAVVLTFADGASVQIDDVSMIGASQAEKIDEMPVGPDSTWTPNLPGTFGTVTPIEGGVSVSGITSDASAWYAPQITSNQFKTREGVNYTVSAKLKLEGTSNNKVKFIVQNQGSWEVVKDVTEIDLSTLGTPDADGFYTYTTTFSCGGTYSNVAFNWGLGHSEASDATFSFKDVTMSVDATDEGEGNGGTSMGETPAGFSNITYILGDNAVNAEQNPTFVTKAEGTIELADPTRDGYIFLGWTTVEDSTDYITKVSTKEDSTVYAQWEVRVDAEAPTITKQPVTVECVQGDATTLNVEAEVAKGMLSYQWYVASKASGKDGVAINGATSAAYKPATDLVGTKYYYCEVKNTDESAEINGDTEVITKSLVVAVTVSAKKEEAQTPSQPQAPEQPQTPEASQTPPQPQTSTTQQHTHTWSTEYTIIKNATAAETGLKGHKCTGCDEFNPNTKVEIAKYTVKLNAKSVPLQVKKSTTAIKATVMDGDKVVSWKSDKPSVAKVNNKGKITGKKAGTAKITVTTEKGATATVTIKVQKGKVKTKSVSVTNAKKNKLTLKKGNKFTLETSVNPITSSEKVKFKSSDKKIVAVTSKGKLTAKKKGKAKITVTSGSKTKVVTITVK